MDLILKCYRNFYLTFFLLNFSSFIFCSHNASRYFPFLERFAEYITKKKSHISPSFFIARASTAFKRGGGNTGIPELWGKYDLKDIINSLELATDGDFVNPIQEERGPNDTWINKSIKFKVNGKLKARGLILNYKQHLGFNSFSFGGSLPIMHVNASDNFEFLPKDSDNQVQDLREGELAQLDIIRRKVHDELNVSGGDWTKTGLGDLDLYLNYNKIWDHKLLMKSIDLNIRSGITVPIGTKSDNNYPSSVSFMGNGHWSFYFDTITELELKQDWKFGFLVSAIYQFRNSRKLRIPVYKEPAVFSALVADVQIDPGMTFKLSPYIIAANLTDGINFLLRYSYLRHNKNKWKDKRKDPNIKSYLSQIERLMSGEQITSIDIEKNNQEKKD